MVVKYNEVDVHVVYLVAFEQMGRKCAKYLVSICALRGMITSLLNVAHKIQMFKSQSFRAAEMFTEATKIELIFVFVAPTEVIPVGLSFGSTQGSHLDGNTEMRDMVFMSFASSLTSHYKVINSFFRAVENLGACCQTGVSKIVMASLEAIDIGVIYQADVLHFSSYPCINHTLCCTFGTY
ncbi:hypothetical protein GQ457_09G023890 [Hibiscus cannabinus]